MCYMTHVTPVTGHVSLTRLARHRAPWGLTPVASQNTARIMPQETHISNETSPFRSLDII